MRVVCLLASAVCSSCSQPVPDIAANRKHWQGPELSGFIHSMLRADQLWGKGGISALA